MRILLSILALSGFLGQSPAQQTNFPQLDSLFNLLDQHDRGMGSVSIVKNGQEIYRKSAGYANMEKEHKATADTRYRIGSITKTYTATIIMQMIEEGKLTLNTRLSTFFPEIPNADVITVELMLRHRSGIYNFTNDTAYRTQMNQQQNRNSLLAIIKQYTSAFEPGSQTGYSNSNYVLLAFIAEEMDGMAYEKIVERRILKPCRLKNTVAGTVQQPGKKEALPYLWWGGWENSSLTHLSVARGAGNIVATASDVSKFYDCLFTGKLVGDSTLKYMARLVDDFGAGFMKFESAGKSGYSHNGGIDAFQSLTVFIPEDTLSITYLSNGVSIPMLQMINAIISLYYTPGSALPEIYPLQVIDAASLSRLTGLYISDNFPLPLTISLEEREDGKVVLLGRAEGQSSFPLDYTGNNRFVFLPADILIEFDPEQGSLKLEQGRREFRFTRKQQ